MEDISDILLTKSTHFLKLSYIFLFKTSSIRDKHVFIKQNCCSSLINDTNKRTHTVDSFSCFWTVISPTIVIILGRLFVRLSYFTYIQRETNVTQLKLIQHTPYKRYVDVVIDRIDDDADERIWNSNKCISARVFWLFFFYQKIVINGYNSVIFTLL